MASLFKPDIEKENPKIAAMREREQRRAEIERTEATQAQLAAETARRRGLGLRALLGPLGLGSLSSTLGAG